MSEAGVSSILALQPRLALPRAFAALPRRTDRDPIKTSPNWILPLFGSFGARSRQSKALKIGRSAFRAAIGLKRLSAEAINERRRTASARLRRDGLSGKPLVIALAIAADMCRQELRISPYGCQLAAAVSLTAGQVVEMDTGEGKTISAFLAAAACALAGRTVHIVTANDYLAERDHAYLAPVLTRLGLTSGVIVESTVSAARAAAYRSDVTFVSGKEVAFDYLRDSLVRDGETIDRNISLKLSRALGTPETGSILQPVLDVAIIDEIDSVLIDEAVTPLIISAPDGSGNDAEVIPIALKIAENLRQGRHYRFDSGSLLPDLTREGAEEVERLAPTQVSPWAIRLRREELIRSALAALEGLVRDRDYLLRDGKVVIIDPHSGRTMADRQWGRELHAMVEAKERMSFSGARKSLASISFQRFFRGYQHLAGMSGTVGEVATELATIYGLPMTRIPRRLPLRRKYAGRHVFATREDLWRAAGAEVAKRNARGQPVMIAVRSVHESLRAAAELDKRGIAYRLLSAAQDRDEAEIIAGAGQRGAITVVTNMAGRGTDIKLGDGVAALGGLAVLICERHESRRVDRQLMGRAARQGDPGTVVEFLSCQDTTLAPLSTGWHRLLRGAVGRFLFAGAAFRRVQITAEKLGEKRRFDLVRRDEHLARTLAFAGGLD